METTNREYTNGTVTVVWKPDLCIHIGYCWQGLPQVFDPDKTPWINVTGASTEEIIAQVKECPSGALTFYLNKVEFEENTASVMVVEILPNGPLVLHGDIIIRDTEGHETRRQGTTCLCRCGASANKPYCDGSHKKVDFQG